MQPGREDLPTAGWVKPRSDGSSGARSGARAETRTIAKQAASIAAITIQPPIAGVAPLLAARRVHAVGVRSCYGVAHYLACFGTMAFDNFVPVPSVPGAILDQISGTGPEDIVVAITHEHCSAEVVRACQVARDRGARVLALTDAPASPVAAGAWKVILLPMVGPQLIPSLTSAFLVVEMILAAMAAKSDGAAERIAGFEDRVARFGSYFTG